MSCAFELIVVWLCFGLWTFGVLFVCVYLVALCCFCCCVVLPVWFGVFRKPFVCCLLMFVVKVCGLGCFGGACCVILFSLLVLVVGLGT